MSKTALTKSQREIMCEFYGKPATKVIFDKTERNKLWNLAKNRSAEIDFSALKRICPAIENQIRRSYSSGANIQSAVFSECVYAQTLANMFNLTLFNNCLDNPGFISDSIKRVLATYSLVPRYAYSTKDKRRMLIQAGSCNGVDSVLITVVDLEIYTIEYKEPAAKTEEHDLPPYKENGDLVVTNDWLNKYPQYKDMLGEHKDLNFYRAEGNINSFSKKSIIAAVLGNDYALRIGADVICTEDKNGYLTMIPRNQVDEWAEVQGEIRPAGRNNFKVWTPVALKRFLKDKGAVINGSNVSIKKTALEERAERGGGGRVSGYKITRLFFVRVEKCKVSRGKATFDINDVRQLKPTIAAKVFFNDLKHSFVKNYYGF